MKLYCEKRNKQNNCYSIIQSMLVIFLCIQPIFDVKLFYNSIGTMIRVVIISLMFLYCFYKNKDKNRIYIYVFALAIYIVFHHWNATSFASMEIERFKYSFFKESMYFLKMITPYMLIYVLHSLKLSNKTSFTIVKVIILIMGGTIILSNIFVISYGSYSDTKIQGSFFSWFNKENTDTFKNLASKGFFEFANQISAVLLMFLPFSIYNTYKNLKISEILILSINLFSLMLLGTRVAVFGVVIVFMYTIIISLFEAKVLKKDSNKTIKLILPISILIVYIGLLPINPVFDRINEMNNQVDLQAKVVKETIADDLENQTEWIKESKEEQEIKYILNNYKEKQIYEQFIFHSYPYQYDTEFWLQIFEEDISLRTNYRYLEKEMIKRVVKINNNYFDKLFGITNTRIQNIFNIEQDFVMQYYALGIVGVFLIFLPYFLHVFYYAYINLRTKLSNCNTIDMVSFTTIIFTFCISYYSGNLLNSLSFSIYFSLLYGFLTGD